MSGYRFIETAKLEIGYLEWNPAGRKTAVLMHGWPDSPETWREVAQSLAEAGYRALCPALRGFGPTRFRFAETRRSGQLAALGHDLLDFVDALGLESPLLVGHDWGARAVANACGLRPGVASHLVMLSVGYGTNVPNQTISYLQACNYWYQWLMATPRGERAVAEDRRAFARWLWDTWSPAGWYTPEAFAEAATAFDNPDWAAVVLHSYRHRWGFVTGDPDYLDAEARLDPAPVLDTPALILHGAADACNHPDSSAGRESFFAGPYQRLVLDGIGHFPQREAPSKVVAAILGFVGAAARERARQGIAAAGDT